MPFGRLSLMLPCIAGLSLSYPLNAGDPEPIYAYLPSPTGRGTVGLVYTCLLTLALCLWTAMHPNISLCQSSWLYGPAYKATWILLAIIFLEFVVCCAASQFFEARALHKTWEAYWLKRGDCERQRWLGCEGAFLVVMGGYKITCPGGRLPASAFTSPDNKSAQEMEPMSSEAPRPIACTHACGVWLDHGQPVRRTLTPAGLKTLLALQDGTFS